MSVQYKLRIEDIYGSPLAEFVHEVERDGGDVYLRTILPGMRDPAWTPLRIKLSEMGLGDGTEIDAFPSVRFCLDRTVT